MLTDRLHRFFYSSKLPAWCVLVGGLLLSFLLFSWVYNNEKRSEQEAFKRWAERRIHAVEEGVSDAIAVLRTVNRIFVMNDGEVSRAQFHLFVTPLLEAHRYIEGLTVSRVVSKTQRGAFEAHMQLRDPNFTISEMVDGKRVPASDKDYYRVLDYIEPPTPDNAALFGMDASSPSFADSSMQRATDTAQPAASPLYPLLKGAGKEPGVRIRMAIYKGGVVPAEVAERRLNVAGYTSVILRADDLFEKIFDAAGAFGNEGLDIQVYAAAVPDAGALAYNSVSATGSANEPAGTFLTHSHHPTVSHTFDVAGTPWHIVIAAQETPFFASHTGSFFCLLIGLLTTLAATANLRALLLRTQRIEELVSQRTNELHTLNARLSDDIKARKKAEAALVQSEQRARQLADLSSDWYWELDDQFRFTSLSSKVMEQDGTTLTIVPPVTFGKTRWEQAVDLETSDWAAHRAMLEAHQPFKNFEFKTIFKGMSPQWFSAAGMPLFDEEGRFTGYRGTSRNITVRKEAEEALRRSEAELRLLTAHLNKVKEQERKRIARDIHDELGQSLMALRIKIAMLEALPAYTCLIKERVADALEQTDATIKSVRAIINDLRPSVLDLGLHAAVEWEARQFEQSSGIACELLIDHEEFFMDDMHATHLFRIVQEALTNILRHAQASHVKIQMLKNDDIVFMQIADDGIGLAPDAHMKANTFGLVSIKERVQAMGGRVCFANNAEQGMAIMLWIPI